MMVKAMGSLHSEDFTEEQYGSLVKRSRFNQFGFQQLSSDSHAVSVPPSQYNPLDEPSPLGLRLRKSPSLLDLIQMRLSQGGNVGSSMAPSEIIDSESKKDVKGFSAPSSAANDKLKASNFPALLLRIGSWEYVSTYEGDLVAKCYFAKHKLVWEVLESGLKSKIEIQWSDIMALKAECPDNGPGTLTIMLARRPTFFRETNPQPRKHTLWQATTDFTDGQASLNKVHSLQCPPGALNKHYEKLIQCDTRLSILTRQPKIDMGSSYFDPDEVSSEEHSSEEFKGAAKESPVSAFEDAAARLSAFKFEHEHFPPKNVSKVSSPSSGHKNSESVKVPGLRPSISMSDFMNQLENHISEQMTSRNLPSAKASECQAMLDNIAQDLLNDTQCLTGLDERSLMKKVNSLCNVLQVQDPAREAEVLCGPGSAENDCFALVSDSTDDTVETTSEGSVEASRAMPRRDSLGDLLVHLPRIASLPKFSNFLFGIDEDDEYDWPN
ncbi:enhanced downy mildew 1 2 [Striga asiatica]|uniref:Enhanced downy mildew 1 2 n=1 Tax=Striga asiatica TaxID=4170 RepID=A0A5A7QNZ3_STRAF|nr:enhanced downy mildew 1 2 [Striga asiatica]